MQPSYWPLPQTSAKGDHAPAQTLTHCTLAHFRGKPVRRHAHGGSTFSGVGLRSTRGILAPDFAAIELIAARVGLRN
jgi:hypothetical protein